MAAVTTGAEVFSADGEKLGKVRHLFSAAPESLAERGQGFTTDSSQETENEREAFAQRQSSAAFAMDRVTAVDTGSAVTGVPLGLDHEPRDFSLPGSEDGISLGPSDTKYLEVHHGGLLHRGSSSFYVPFKAISTVEGDGSIVLQYTRDEVISLFIEPPKPLDGE